MRETTRLRDALFALLDPRFGTQGFKRRKDSFTWRHRRSSELTFGLHLNVGAKETAGTLAAHPRIGLRHDTIERALVSACAVTASSSRDRFTFGQMLAQVAGGDYQTDLARGPEPLADQIWADWCAAGQPALENMADLEQVAMSLASDQPHKWWCASRSDRARLLPLVLKALGREQEALAWLAPLRADLEGRDQLLPPFTEFERWFRAAAS